MNKTHESYLRIYGIGKCHYQNPNYGVPSRSLNKLQLLLRNGDQNMSNPNMLHRSIFMDFKCPSWKSRNFWIETIEYHSFVMATRIFTEYHPIVKRDKACFSRMSLTWKKRRYLSLISFEKVMVFLKKFVYTLEISLTVSNFLEPLYYFF